MTADAIQLALQQEGFVPVAEGSDHYVAAVQNKPGELEALRQASPETWSRFTPLVQIVGPKTRPQMYRRETVAGWVKRLAAAVGQRPCFLDILRLRPEHPTMTSNGMSPVLSIIHAAARKRGLVFVPVLPIGCHNDTNHTRIIGDAAARDGRGASLRYPIRRFAMPPGSTHTTVLAAAVENLGIDATYADVIVDVGYLSSDEELHPDDIGEALNEVDAVGRWRSVVLLGTSMPSMLGGTIAEGTIGELPRREWDLWSALKQHPPERLPTYGDYLVQHPDPPHDDDSGGPSMRANIRYTINDKTLIVRGRGPVIQEGKEQYRGLCQQLVARPEFAGSDFSWGDAQIAACAVGEIEPGGQNQWRGAGSSHHLRLVTQQISH
ncbi:MAG TPA: beta family protein [Mycobacteriales bacterium]|nr:beta family protein [Mycobacteriales bacterium]